MQLQVAVFDVLLDDICSGSVRKASFAGLIKTDDYVEKLIKALRLGKCVTQVDLSRCLFGKKGVEQLCGFLDSKDCCLEKLILLDCQLVEMEFRMIWESLKRNKSVKSLTITSNHSDVWSSVSEALKQNNTLTKLDARRCNMSPLSIGLLAASLSINQSLRVLSFDQKLGCEDAGLFAKVLLTNQSLQILCIMVRFIETRFKDALISNQTLKILDLSCCSLGFEGEKHIAECFKVNNSITKLYLMRCYLDRGGVSNLCDSLKANTSLTKFKVSFNSLGPDDGRAIGDLLEHNRTLTSIDAGNNHFGVEGLFAIADGLKSNQVLKKLVVSYVYGHVGQFLGTVLIHNNSVTEIDVSGNKVEVDGDRLICGGLKANTTLRKLHLCGVELERMQVIAEGIQANKTLQYLNVSYNHFGFEGARSLCDALTVNRSLEELHMYWTKIDLSGCYELVRMLKSNKCLKTLDFCSNDASSSGGIAVFDALSSNNRLESLLIGYNKLKADCAPALCNLIAKNNTLTKIDVSGSELGSCSQTFVESIANSQSVTYIKCWDCGLETEHVLNALCMNKNLLDVEGLDDYRIKALCSRNKFLREQRVESSMLTLLAMKKHLTAIPKEILLLIGTYLMKTKEDVRSWRVPLSDE